MRAFVSGVTRSVQTVKRFGIAFVGLAFGLHKHHSGLEECRRRTKPTLTQSSPRSIPA